MKTLEEVQQEIREVINKTPEIETRLQKLREKGYTVNYSWVKGGTIGRTWYLKRKNIYRIQVGASEANGEFFKAYCVEISDKKISILKLNN
jgi:hypothetical protein